MPQKKSQKAKSSRAIKKVKVTDHRGTREVLFKPKPKSTRRNPKKKPRIQWKSAGAASYRKKKK